jgi:hypothetical protein
MKQNIGNKKKIVVQFAMLRSRGVVVVTDIADNCKKMSQVSNM